MLFYDRMEFYGHQLHQEFAFAVVQFELVKLVKTIFETKLQQKKPVFIQITSQTDTISK